MTLVIPHIGRLQETDARIMRLAEFLGIRCEQVPFEKHLDRPSEYLIKRLPEHGSCLLVNPQVIKEWTGGVVPVDLIPCLTSRFSGLLVHGITAEHSFEQNLISALSGGRLHSAQPVPSGQLYWMAPNSEEICGAFSGLSFGPVNPANDLVLPVNTDNADVRTPISIGDSPFMATMKRDNTQIVFLASADVLDVNDEMRNRGLGEYFSRFVPQAMALRYLFGEKCWRPYGHYASLIIDDPLLRPRYGNLDYSSLLKLMKEYNFSTTIAFIPHNYRRNSRRTVEMFRQSDGRLAICFHGNDHTAGEFASADPSRINTMVRNAEKRMNLHTDATGLRCPKVMVFPQDDFSVEAMRVLKSHNFCGAVCGRVHPLGRQVDFRIGEAAQPAAIRHGTFPLFLRNFVGRNKKHDIALNLFFGKPVLVTEHHRLFGQVKDLVEDVRMINSVAPAIRWSDLETALLNSTLRRRTPDGTEHIRAYCRVVPITNDSDLPRPFLVEWTHSSESPPIERVLQDGAPIRSFIVDDSTIRVSLEVPPRSCRTVSVTFRNEYSSVEGLGFLWDAKAFTRRRLSEMRDNYISKNEFTLAVGEALKRRVLSKLL